MRVQDRVPSLFSNTLDVLIGNLQVGNEGRLRADGTSLMDVVV